jgi:hypothetical protein
MPLSYLDIASSRAAMAYDDQSLGELFLENTKLHPTLTMKAGNTINASGKSYPFAPRQPVPADLAAVLAAPAEIMMALELYLVARDGLYHYNTSARELETLPVSSSPIDVSALFPADVAVPPPTVLIIVTGVPLRLTTRDGERGYRTMLLHAGRVAQFVAGRVIDRFFDDRVSALIGVDGVNELPLLLLARD